MKAVLYGLLGAVVGITLFTAGWWLWAWKTWSRDH